MSSDLTSSITSSDEEERKIEIDILRSRRYQDEALVAARDGNVIIRMPTGSGKTHVAVMLIKDMLSLPLEQGEAKSKKIIFLVDKTLLVHQHLTTVKSYMPSLAASGRLRSYYGMNCDSWPVDQWKKEFDSLDVAVMTAQIFLNQLRAGTWSLEKCQLIVYDECHHATKNHPYITIQKEVYHQLRQSRRPKILGLTASPIYNSETERAMRDLAQLESILDCRIHETKIHVHELQLFSPTPMESIYQYPIPEKGPPVYSSIYPMLKSCAWIFDAFTRPSKNKPESRGKMYLALLEMLKDLGQIGADIYLFLWIKEFKYHVENHPLFTRIKEDPTKLADLNSLHMRIKSEIESFPTFQPYSVFNTKINPSRLNSPMFVKFPKELGTDQLNQAFSPKVRLFLSILNMFRPSTKRGDKFRCLVFCQTRLMCEVLYEIVKRFSGFEWIQAGWLVGHGDSKDGLKRDLQTEVEAEMKMNEQVRMMNGFRNGEFNLLVATNIAEEGIDVPSCNLVIRFDAPQHIVGYVQSRGRARQEKSQYVMLAGTEDAKRKMVDWREKEQILLERFRERERLELLDEQHEPNHFMFKKPGVQAYLTGHSAVMLMAAVCNVYRDEYTPDAKPIYEEVPHPHLFQFRLQLPVITPLTKSERRITSGEWPSKKKARQHAAFKAAIFLQEKGKVDENWQPVKLPRRSGNQLEYWYDGYGNKVTPTPLPEKISSDLPNVFGDIWQDASECWLHTLGVEIHQKTVTVGFICGRKLDVNEFGWKDIDYDDDVSFKITGARLLRWSDADIKKNEMNRLDVWSRKCYMVALNRRFEKLDILHSKQSSDGKEPEKSEYRMLWIFAPLTKEGNIDWRLVDEPWSFIKSAEDLSNIDTLIITPHRPFTTRVYSFVGIRKDLNSSSQLQLPLARRAKWNSYEEWFSKAGRYYPSIRDTGTESSCFYLELTALPKSRNFLSIQKNSLQVPKEQTVMIPSNLCAVDRLGTPMWRIFRYMPSLTRKIHDDMIANIAMTKLHMLDIPRTLIVQALTMPACDIGYDYERLEFLGDAFAKLASTIHLYLLDDPLGRPLDEGTLSCRRQASINNFTFRSQALNTRLHEHFITIVMRSRNGYRPHSVEQHSLSSDGQTLSRQIARRTLSDVTEALMGAAYTSGGFDTALRISRVLQLTFGKEEDGSWKERWLKKWGQNGRFDTGLALQSLEEELGHKFHDSRVLLRALSHRSYILADGCYERDEFLGDAVVDFFVAQKLYNIFPLAPPGRLTMLRALLVCNSTLAYLSLKLGLHQHLRISPASLATVAIQKASVEYSSFSAETQKRNADWLETMAYSWDPPKILGDIFEAVMGAVFWDLRFETEKLFGILERLFSEIFEIVIRTEGEGYEDRCLQSDPWSQLLNRVVNTNYCEKWKVIHSPGESGFRRVQIFFHDHEIGDASGRTRRLAKMLAAQQANAWWLDHQHLVMKSKSSAEGYEEEDKICDCHFVKLQRREEAKRQKGAETKNNLKIPEFDETGKEVNGEQENVEKGPDSDDEEDEIERNDE